MRWVATEVFVADEPNPFPAGTPVVRRRVRAIPIDPSPWRWLIDVYGAPLARYLARRDDAVTGQVWVRRSVLRWRRAAWTLWLIVSVAAVVHVAVRGGGDEQVVRDFSGEVLVLVVLLSLLFSRRLQAVLDQDNNEVGIRGS